MLVSKINFVLYRSLLQFFYTLSFVEGALLFNPYISQDGRLIIESPDPQSRGPFMLEGNKKLIYHKFHPLKKHIDILMHKISDLSDLEEPSEDNLNYLVEFFNALTTCKTSLTLMDAPIFFAQSDQGMDLNDAKSLVDFKIVAPGSDLFKNQNQHFIPLRILHHAMVIFSQSIRSIELQLNTCDAVAHLTSVLINQAATVTPYLTSFADFIARTPIIDMMHVRVERDHRFGANIPQ